MSARIVQTCEQCRQPFGSWAIEVARGKSRFCSRECWKLEFGERRSSIYEQKAIELSSGASLVCSRCGKRKPLTTIHFAKSRKRGLAGHCRSCIRRQTAMPERFWQYVNKNGPTVRPELGRCWVWTAFIPQAIGYGRFSIKIGGRHKSEGAHRVSWFLAHGAWRMAQ